jgi:hypothetical protein
MRFRIGAKTVRHSVVTRGGLATATSASTRDWAISRVICGSRFGAYPGMSVDPGYATSYDGRDDMRYRHWIYTPQFGWRHYNWSQWYRTPALGGWFIGGLDPFGLRAEGSSWAFVLVQKHWFYARHYQYIYPTVESSLGGFTSGGWCWWTG